MSSDQGEFSIIERDIENEMSQSYVTYAMSVIASRALPDVRDGLKPSQRRILYAMRDLGLYPHKKYRKCAKISGDTSGNYHPHGEQVIYPTLVRMAQDFNMRYRLIDGQGNFGSIDGDPPAAMRYTEAKMRRTAMLMMEDIDKDTVDFVPNYDETLTEPTVLPSVFPNLLCNGSTGIAVGMATNMAPHNVCDVVDTICAYIDNPQVTVDELIAIIKAPDFPTGGIIYGLEGLLSAYRTGKGVIKVRAKTEIVDFSARKKAIIISEIPYQVNKTNLLENIVSLVQNKQINGISDIRDESDKSGLRIVIEVKKEDHPDVILNQLFQHTQMETSFGVNNLALVNQRPQLLDLKKLVGYHVDHRKEIITRRTRYELRKAERRVHILEALLTALDSIDQIITLIRSSKNTQEAKMRLMAEFNFTDIQAQAILEMQLQRLTNLERDKVKGEYDDLQEKIKEYKYILTHDEKILEMIKEELVSLKDEIGDERRTEINNEVMSVSIEELIPKQDLVIMRTYSGYVKSIPLVTYRQQHRGGKGVTGMGTKDDDFVCDVFIANTHQYILFFTNKGRVYWEKGYNIPQGGRTAKGKAVVNVLDLKEDEHVRVCIPVKEFDDEHFLMFFSRKGYSKKTVLTEYSRPRKDGIIALKINDDDELMDVKMTNGQHEVVLGTKLGMSVRFHESNVRQMGRSARGVKAVTLKGEDEVVGALTCEGEVDVLTLTDKGYGKKTSSSAYRLQQRGGVGVKNIRIGNKVGQVIALMHIDKGDEILMVSEKSMVVRCCLDGVRRISRNTQGVRVMKLSDKDRLNSVAKIKREFKEDSSDE